MLILRHLRIVEEVISAEEHLRLHLTLHLLMLLDDRSLRDEVDGILRLMLLLGSQWVAELQVVSALFLV